MNMTLLIVLMKFSGGLNIFCAFYVKACVECRTNTQFKENEEEGQEGFPKEVACGTES